MSDERDSVSKPKVITVIHCWSAPRSRSTALCYSFESRINCVALDEPSYRAWLIQQGSTVTRPYLKEIIAGEAPIPGSDAFNVYNKDVTVISDSAATCKWKRELLSKNERIIEASTKLNDGGVIFCKEIAKFHTTYDFSNEIQAENGTYLCHRHVLLLRDPVSVLSSWSASGTVHGHNPTPDEVGIVSLFSIYSKLQSRLPLEQQQLPLQQQQRSPVTTSQNGDKSDLNATTNVLILDSDDLVSAPARVLKELCSELGIPYMESMLKWKSGPHDCDGPWSKWWYHDVHKSEGWDVGEIRCQQRRYPTLKQEYMLALKTSTPAYDFLKRQSMTYLKRLPLPTQIYEDPRNEHLLVYVGTKNDGGRIIPRDMASVSPWDSAVQGGDACWEGLRVYRGKILHLDRHLKRLRKSAKSLGFLNCHSKDEIVEAIFRVLAANGMRDGAHMRLTLTRGEKCTSSMNPKFNVYGTTLIILPEWKPTEGATTYNNVDGVSLISASQRRNSPQTVDSKIHHNNLINNILPKIQANLAGAADAIMLDLEGFVSETNATNIFMVDDGVLFTPHADHCLPGITREAVLELAHELNIPAFERRITLAEFHSADEVFTTGTMGELTPVTMIDGRIIGSGKRGPVTQRLQELYKTLPERGDKYATPIPEFDA